MEEETRADRFTFYVMAIMSFLESTVPTFVDNLQVLFKDDKGMLKWLNDVWLPEEFAHGQQGRQFIAETWPEFDWENAYQDFIANYGPRCSHEMLRSSLAMEALCRCVTETEATMFYRCIGSYTKSKKLGALMQKLSADETRHYRVFRDVFERYDKIEKHSTFSKMKTILFRTELTRDEDVKMAFMPLNDHWHGEIPFERYDYSDFLANAKEVIIKHFPVEPAKRMLFKPIQKNGFLNKVFLTAMEILVKSHYLGLTAQLSLKNHNGSFNRRATIT